MAIVYYDGNCGFCKNVVRWLIHKRLPRTIQFAKLEGQYGDNLKEVQPELKNVNAIMVANHSEVYLRSDAVIYLLKQLDGYSVLGYLMELFPKKLRDYGYNFVAKNRGRIKIMKQPELTTLQERRYFID